VRDPFGKALELRRQIAQMLFDRGRRSVARQTPNPGRLAAVVVRRHALGCQIVHRVRLGQRSEKAAATIIPAARSLTEAVFPYAGGLPPPSPRLPQLLLKKDL
jgi:hypothetical protein